MLRKQGGILFARELRLQQMEKEEEKPAKKEKNWRIFTPGTMGSQEIRRMLVNYLQARARETIFGRIETRELISSMEFS